MASVTRVAAAVGQHRAVIAIGDDPPAHAIGDGAGTLLVAAGGVAMEHGGVVGAAHDLPDGGAFGGAHILTIPGRPGRGDEAEPFGVVGGAHLEAAHGVEGTVLHGRLFGPGLVFPAIAHRPLVLGMDKDIETAGGHAQRR